MVKLNEVRFAPSFPSPELMRALIMNLTYTKVKFHPKVKFQTGLSSLWVSCKHALRNLELVNLRNCKSISVFKEKKPNFIRPSQNSVFDIHNPKGIKLITRLRLGLSHLREHKLGILFSVRDSFVNVSNLQILSDLLKTYFTENSIFGTVTVG